MSQTLEKFVRSVFSMYGLRLLKSDSLTFSKTKDGRTKITVIKRMTKSLTLKQFMSLVGKLRFKATSFSRCLIKPVLNAGKPALQISFVMDKVKSSKKTKVQAYLDGLTEKDCS